MNSKEESVYSNLTLDDFDLKTDFHLQMVAYSLKLRKMNDNLKENFGITIEDLPQFLKNQLGFRFNSCSIEMHRECGFGADILVSVGYAIICRIEFFSDYSSEYQNDKDAYTETIEDERDLGLTLTYLKKIRVTTPEFIKLYKVSKSNELDNISTQLRPETEKNYIAPYGVTPWIKLC
jgi:hypothetical protein